jgi:membrane carboxypeptidase/penicillin-binding protein PbpC
VPCSWHHQSDEGLLTVYPAEYRAWAGSEQGAALRPSPVAPRPSLLTPRASPLAIASPAAGATYSIDPTLRREFQALSLRAVTARPTTVHWLVDGVAVGTASSEAPLSWPLQVGMHEIEARDLDGRRTSTRIVVR